MFHHLSVNHLVVSKEAAFPCCCSINDGETLTSVCRIKIPQFALIGDRMPDLHTHRRSSSRFLTIPDWLQDVAGLLLSWLAQGQDWRTLLYKSDEGIEVFVRKGGQINSIGIAPLQGIVEGLARIKSKAPRRGSTVLRLATDEVLKKMITLPSAAEDVIIPILSNQMERMTPWSKAQAMFGYKINQRNETTGKLEICVVASSRERVNEALAEVRSAQFNPTLVDHADGPKRGNGTVLAYVDQRGKQRVSRFIASVLGVLLFASFLTCIVGMWDVYRFRLALHETEKQIAAARQGIAKTKTQGNHNKRVASAIHELIELKSQRPSAFVLIEALSRHLPDDVSLDRLEMDHSKVQLIGEGTNTASLISLLEGTEHFSNVRFSAPTTRTPRGKKERFTITAQPLAVFELGD